LLELLPIISLADSYGKKDYQKITFRLLVYIHLNSAMKRSGKILLRK